MYTINEKNYQFISFRLIAHGSSDPTKFFITEHKLTSLNKIYLNYFSN